MTDPPRDGASGPPDPPPDERSEHSIPLSQRTFYCDLCGAVMINRHCKLSCPVCGYQRDCSDP